MPEDKSPKPTSTIPPVVNPLSTPASKPAKPIETIITPVSTKEVTQFEKEREELRKKIAACDAHYGGVGNIPVKHPYWDWVNQLRAEPPFEG